MQFVLNPQHTQTIPAVVATIPDNPTFTFMDSPQQKRVTVHIDGTQIVFVLWQGAAYDAAGDYTQAQISAAVTAYLQAHQPTPPAPAATPAPVATASVSTAVATSAAPASTPATPPATPAS